MDRHGSHSHGVFKGEVVATVDPEILEYAQHVVKFGAPSRIPKTGERVKSKPYSSYIEYEQEGVEKTKERKRKQGTKEGETETVQKKQEKELMVNVVKAPAGEALGMGVGGSVAPPRPPGPPVNYCPV